ncbi:peptide/nickel transport system substrate-binding protein [Mesobacillus persicus]|uniref:Peptide/nickel transport system substrate-binding protein n=1 Tax=Mesobacillus persicus TaxID=930146 RepID=A0A1H7Z9M4_9BACI|nr:ABC transporter substrate-binding protein [Mesobacillus persicus]SEM54955.1 peptide/nickel transport system substrate-binding protein [Mesobacillus persicus]
MDAPGPWGTGPFLLSKGYSSINNVPAIIKKKPFEATWLTVKENRTPSVVLDANQNYWNKNRGPRLNKIVFRNDVSQEQALHLCTTAEGQVDIVTQVQPKDAKKVIMSSYAKLVTAKGNQVLAGVFNRFKKDVNFNDRNLRLALNLAVDREELVQRGFHGYADPVPAMTPPWAIDYPEDLTPRAYDQENARALLKKANWPEGRKLKLAATKKQTAIAKLIANQIQRTLRLRVDVIIIPEEHEVNWMRIVAEKKLVPAWDILLANATALFYEDTPAFFHREFFGANGALRAGPELPQFNQLFQNMAGEVDKKKRVEVAKEIDRYAFKEVLALFLCIPQSLYAVNKQVKFHPYRTTFELAETEVTVDHWSRRNYPGRA